MNPIEQIALAWQALSRTFLQSVRPGLWTPGLVLGGLQLLMLAALSNYAHPWVSWVTVPLLRRIAGEGMLHYPQVLRALPDLYSRCDFVLAAVAGSVLFGAATLLFAARFRRAPPSAGAALREAGRKSASLILVQLPVYALILGLAHALQRALRPGSSGGLTALLYLTGVVSVTGAARALFLYLPAVVVLEGRSAVQALRELPRTWTRGLWGALFLVFVLMLPLVPLQVLFGQGAALEARLGPEVMILLVLAQIVVGVATWFLLSGSATLTYLGAVMDFDEWGGG